MRLAWLRKTVVRGVVARDLAVPLVMLFLAACATPHVAAPGGEVSAPALGE